jgi:competence protein ComEC
MDARDSIRTSLAPAACALLVGVLAMLASPGLPSMGITAAVGCAGLAAFLGRHLRACRLIVWACCGFLYAGVQAQSQLQRSWPVARADERVEGVARIESIPRLRGADISFDARVRLRPRGPAGSRGARELRVRVISRDPLVIPRAGERWVMVLALRPPRGPVNSGSFDVERLLFQEGVHALGTVVPSRSNRRISQGSHTLVGLRERIARSIERRVVDRDAAALLCALSVGATGSMSREQWRVFNATGTTHLVAISGLHVTFFALVAFACARFFWRTLGWRFLPGTRDGFAAGFGLCAATAYAVLAGFSVPTQRTLLMLAACLLAKAAVRHCPPQQPMAIALIAVLLFDPLAPLAPGFWLSFAAAAVLVLVATAPLSPRGALGTAVSLQLSVHAALVPVTLASFGSASLIGPLANVPAIPFFTWLLVPVTLLALAALAFSSTAADGLLGLGAWLHDLSWPWLVTAADLPWALVFASPPIWACVLAGAAAVSALPPWPIQLRAALAAAVLPLLATGSREPASGEAHLDVLDCGAGAAVVVRTARHVLVHGTCESYGSNGGRSEGVLIPHLRSRGVGRIDRFVVPRIDGTTGPGVDSVFAALPVGELLVGGALTEDGPARRTCGSRAAWVWDHVRFRMSGACDLDVEMPTGSIALQRGTVRVTKASGEQWVLVSGRGGRRSTAIRPPGVSGAPEDGILATGDVGAIRFVPSQEGGESAPRGLRQESPAVWRSPPTAAGRKGPV